MQPLHTPIPSGLASGGTFSFVQCVNTSTGMCAGTASHQGTAEESALPCQTWENLQTTQGIPFSEMASAEASRNEQTKTASIDPDSSLDLDLITDNEPFDRFTLHPIAEIELPMDSVELRCPGPFSSLTHCYATTPSSLGRDVMPAPGPVISGIHCIRSVKWLPHWIPG